MACDKRNQIEMRVKIVFWGIQLDYNDTIKNKLKEFMIKSETISVT